MLIATVDIHAGEGFVIGIFLLPVTGEILRVILCHVNDGVATQSCIRKVLGQLIL